MSIPDGLTKLVISGGLGAGAEKWACSLWLDGYTAGTGSGSIDLDALEINTQWVAFRTAVLACMTADDNFNQLDSYYYEGNVAVAHKQKTGSHPGTVSSNVHPFQIAGVLTLRTANATRSGRGRIYLPTHAIPIFTTGQLSGSQLNTCADTLAAWMSTFAESSPLITPVVVSQTHGTKSAITSVENDLILDTQRRRRSKLTSARHAAAVTQH